MRRTVVGDERPARRRRRSRGWLSVAVVLVVLAVLFVWTRGPSGHPLKVDVVSEVGTLIQPDWLRDGGQSGLVGGRILWTFGDTIFREADEEGSHLRSNSWAWSDVDRPFVLHDVVDDGGRPIQLVPFDELEADYNRLSGRPDDRIAVWPTSVLPRDDGSAVLFFREVKVSPGSLNLEVLGSGVATLAEGAEVATRDPTLLFHQPDPVFSAGAVEDDGTVYLYGCTKMVRLQFGCRVARVDADDLHHRSAYEFWDGSRWTDRIGSAVFVLEGPSGGPSVSWNPWLGRYLAVYTLGLSNRVMMRTALHPEGPWSAATEAFTGAPTEGNAVNYAAFEHPELSTDGGRTVTISYFHPLGQFRGEFRMVTVRFA